jgi:hypothetical protein
MVELSNSRGPEDWEVVVGTLYDRGNPAQGAEETVVVHGAEAEARRVYADTVATAAGHGYEYVALRSDGRDIESWPPATGWTV